MAPRAVYAAVLIAAAAFAEPVLKFHGDGRITAVDGNAV